MNSNRNPQPQPLMSLSPTTQQPFNQSRNYNMPQMPPAMPPSGFLPVMPPGIPPPNFPAAAPGFLPPAGFTAPPPPMPPTNSSFNQPPPPPSFGDPPPPPTSSKFQSEPPAPPPPSSTESSNEPAQPKKRKRKSRWGDVEEKTNIPGMPASLPSNVTPEQKEQYLCKFFKFYFISLYTHTFLMKKIAPEWLIALVIWFTSCTVYFTRVSQELRLITLVKQNCILCILSPA